MPRVTITLPGGVPQPYRFQLDHKSVVFGRAAECDIPISCESVSSRHAEMKRVKGGYDLHDLGSTNGIKLNGQRVETVALRANSILELGDAVFEFELGPEEIAVLDMEASVGFSPHRIDAAKKLPPLPQPLVRPHSEYVASAQTEPDVQSSEGVRKLLLCLLALLAFCVGMAVRFQKDTGHSWMEAIRAQFASREALSTPTR